MTEAVEPDGQLRPIGVGIQGLALWPGAGSSRDHSSLLAVEERLARLPVARFDFPYRREGRRAPDRANKLIASLREDLTRWCDEVGTTTDHVVIGGRSMGGRMCSMAVAGATGATAEAAPRRETPLPVAGLLLLSYPLHPPGRPERLRTGHLGDVTVPTLFVSGDRDTFGTPEELAAAHELVAGPVSSVLVPGSRHELAGQDRHVAEVVANWLGLSG